MSGITRAMIMAAGLGTRMRPLTDDRPKPLVTVAGKTMIDHAIDRLKAVGVDQFVVNLHYKAEMLIDHMKARTDVQTIFSDETEGLLGTGGGIVKALHHFADAPFFVHNSDTLWVEGYGSALANMTERWNPETMDALLMMAPLIGSIGYEGRGDFFMDSVGRLSRVASGRVSPFAYPGVQIVHPRLFEDAPEGTFSMNLLWNRAIEASRLFGIRLEGTWFHVGTPSARLEAEKRLKDIEPAA